MRKRVARKMSFVALVMLLVLITPTIIYASEPCVETQYEEISPHDRWPIENEDE